ncbi:MAG: ABC transporter ATP-binding protein [Candidatus Sumerlaeota bacterium]|nr:ABC transporter ATP-binding protein [Candidatus Sumerlaeota bacterium]
MLQLQNVFKRFGDSEPWVLKDLSFTLEPGEGILIQGRSGSGKTTLLHILSGLEPPTEGAVLFNGRNISTLDDASLAIFRNKHIGFCFQDVHVQRHLTVLENVILPLLLRGEILSEAASRGRAILERLGLGGFSGKMPAVLSGGQGQRLVLGRALIGEPDILLADEPTGNLDEETARDILKMILDYQKASGTALVLVTHDAIPPSYNLRRYILSDGRLGAG